MAAVVCPFPLPPGRPEAMTRYPYEATWLRNFEFESPSVPQPPLPQTRTGNFSFDWSGALLGM